MKMSDTQLISGDNTSGSGGNVLLSGGVGQTSTMNGNVIISHRTDNSICELIFNGSGPSPPTVGFRAGTFTGTTTDIKFIWPTTVGEVGQMLKTDGNNPAQLTWDSVMAGVIALDDLSDVTITGPITDKQILRYDGTIWRNLPINLDSILGDVDITTPQNGDILQYNGTFWVNVPNNSPERITATGGGPAVSPTTEIQGTTYITTTGTGNATGVLLDGAYDGMIKRFVAANLAFDGTNYTHYILNTNGSTTFTDANGQVSDEIEFVATGNSISLIWDAVLSTWFIEGAGAKINPN